LRAKVRYSGQSNYHYTTIKCKNIVYIAKRPISLTWGYGVAITSRRRQTLHYRKNHGWTQNWPL